MATLNFLDKTGLAKVWEQATNLFVRKEKKTGSDSDYKVLSDNNLTDELLDKINNAGVSDFGGNYSELYGKPSIEGHELQGGNNTAESLGLATPSDVASATNNMATQTWVQGLGYQTATQVDEKVSTATADMATKTYVTSQGYQTSAQVSSAVSSATAGMATQTWVEGRGYQTASDVSSAISAAVSSVYTPKGSSAFASLPTPAAGLEGDVYNVSDAFTTNATFVEGAGKSYPAGTNVVVVKDSSAYKWDVLSGSVDLSGYLPASDVAAISTEDITTICK